MDQTIALIELDQLPEGRGRRVCRAGYDLALFRFGDTVLAIDDSCPHAGASLSSGPVEGRRVTCRAHGLKFDLEAGCARSGPKLEPRRHRVETVDGVVTLFPPAESAAATTGRRPGMDRRCSRRCGSRRGCPMRSASTATRRSFPLGNEAGSSATGFALGFAPLVVVNSLGWLPRPALAPGPVETRGLDDRSRLRRSPGRRSAEADRHAQDRT